MEKKPLKIAILTLVTLPALTSLSGYGHPEAVGTFETESRWCNDTVAGPDTTTIDSFPRDERHLYMIRALARAKGDSIILRWAPDEYVSWAMSNDWGYNLYRLDDEGNFDTLALQLRPLSIEQMKQRFTLTDSLAGAAAQLIYGQGTALDSVAHEGTDGIIRIHEEQQTRYSYAMLLAEIRPDIAEAMALKFVDHQVRKGENYKYIIGSAIPDSFMRIGTVPVEVENVPYKAAPYKPIITDSIGDNSFMLYWPNSRIYSTHDIERRYNGGKWVKLNKNPHITLTTNDASAPAMNMFEDKRLEPGIYEYRVKGYDSFGDVSNYSDIHKVELPDLIPPTAPVLQRFLVDHSQPGKLYADIIWKKEFMEEDLVGYNIFYYNNEISPDWQQLNLEMVQKEDTLFHCDITGLSSGLITVTAVDTLGNFSASNPYEMHVADLVPPSAPTGLKYVISPSGSVMISWNKNKENDVSRYQLLSANDTTHTFTALAGKLTSDTIIFDTIAVRGVNQKYLYYAVEAYDHSGNVSDRSKPLQVLRKNYDKPQPCRPDSAWMTDEGVHMRWFANGAADVDSFYIYRRLEGSNIGQLIQVLPADSVRNGCLYISDHPKRNFKRRYYYGIETTNTTGLSSELSFEIPFLFKGAMNIPAKISLDGTFRKDIGKIILGWKVDNLDEEILREGYFCLYRKKKNDKFFRFVESIAIQERTTTDREVPAGESAEYEIRIRTSNGRQSPLSNRITIHHPGSESQE